MKNFSSITTGIAIVAFAFHGQMWAATAIFICGNLEFLDGHLQGMKLGTRKPGADE